MTFTASDGTTFEDRNEWRKYEFETNYTIKNKKGERLIKLPGNIDGQPFDIADLEDCQVLLLDHSDQVQIDNLSNCRVFIGSSSESVFVRNCTNCVFTIACKQLRTRDCESCDIYLYSLTDPIIETSTKMRFAPFNGGYNGLQVHMQRANLDPSDNHWNRVYDFNDTEKVLGNWTIMEQGEEAEPWIIDLEEQVPGIGAAMGGAENPVKRDAKAVVRDQDGNVQDGGMQSFSFESSQEQVQQSLDQKEATVEDDPFAAPSDPFGASNSDPFEDPNADPFAPPPLPPTDVQESNGIQAPPAPMPTPVAVSAPVVQEDVEAAPMEEQSFPKLDQFHKEMEEQIADKQKKEAKLVHEVKKTAAESLDSYYNDRTDRLAQRAATNREQEETKLKNQAILKEEASEKPWTRVLDLVDSNHAKPPSSSKSTVGTGNAGNIVKEDVSRMKSILVQLKNSGGLDAA